MKILFTFFLVILFASCSGNSELYKITDSFVESISNNGSYGILDVTDDTKQTKDGTFQVMPVGKLIIVKYLNAENNNKYEDLKSDLKSHYLNDNRVNDVYINQGGTVVIDCR
jgi:hypothetical protein